MTKPKSKAVRAVVRLPKMVDVWRWGFGGKRAARRSEPTRKA